MKQTAYIVNTGIITAIGNDTEACLSSLLGSISGISKAEFLKTNWHAELPVGEVKFSNKSLAEKASAPDTWPRTALLSMIAAFEAWQPFSERAKGLRTGFFSANTVGGMDLTEDFYGGYKNEPDYGEDYQFINHECGAITQLVADALGIHHFVTTISTACSSSANSIMMAAKMIEAGMIDIAIAGGADSLARFTLNGFNTLMILDKEPCQPFDQNRRGLNLGEGAGYLLLMNEKAMNQCDAKAIAKVAGYANANDAYHQTASSPAGTGNQLAMTEAMKIAGVGPNDIGYINLHGTGTANNDSSEGKAIQNIFDGNVPPASSTKAYTGHTLGAAGGVEAVFSTLAIREGQIFPNLRWQNPMDDINWTPVVTLTKADIRHVLSNSFGFGGNCSSLVISKI